MSTKTHPALSLWNPWAGLIRAGVKKWETRSWRPPAALIGQRIYIHASKTDKGWGMVSDDLQQIIRISGIDFWPKGSLICSARLVRFERTEKIRDQLQYQEIAAGDYSDGRYAWEFQDVEQIQPIPWRGSQGIFRVSL